MKVVGLATRYGLDCPGIEIRCSRDFPHPSRPAQFTGSFPGWSGRGVAL